MHAELKKKYSKEQQQVYKYYVYAAITGDSPTPKILPGFMRMAGFFYAESVIDASCLWAFSTKKKREAFLTRYAKQMGNYTTGSIGK